MLTMADDEHGHDGNMLANMANDGHESGFMWNDDDSWAFPILTAAEESGGKMSPEIEKSGDGGKGKEVVETEAGLPPPPKKGKKRRSAAGDGGGGEKSSGEKGGEHEQHIYIERERRKKMRDMFTNLHALIPHLPQRADKSTIVDEAVQYIQKLEQTLESLEQKKAQILKGKTSIITTCDPSKITPHNKLLPFQSREAFLAEQLGSTSKPPPPPVAALSNPVMISSLFSAPEFPAIFKTWTSPNVVVNVCGRDAHVNVCCAKKPGLLTGVCFVLEKYKVEVVSAQVSSDHNRRILCMVHARANGPLVQFPGSLCLVEEIFKQAASEIMMWVQSQCV